MRPSSLSIGFLTVALATMQMSPASAQEFHRHYHYGLVGGVVGLAGAVVVGAVTIATAPIVILGDVLSGGRRDRYYHRDGYYDRRGTAYDYERSGGYAAPPGTYPDAPGYGYGYPRRAYDYPRRTYGPDQEYDRGRSEPDSSDEAYNAPGRGYYSGPPERNAPPPYRSPRHDYSDRYDNGAATGDERSRDDYSGSPDQYEPGQEYGPPRRSYRGDDNYPPPEGE